MSKKLFVSSVFIVILLLVCCFSTTFVFSSAYADNFNPGAPWTLQWQDEFDGPNLDLSKWQYEVMPDTNGGLAYCTDRPQNVYIQNGVLNLRMIRENYMGKPFTTGRINTYGRFAPRYGKVAAKIKLPYGRGVWPAFWLLGNNYKDKTWPKCGELDIVELMGDNGGEIGDRTVISSFHWYVTSEGYTGPADHSLTYVHSQRLADDWHVYEMDWTPTTITFKFDGITVNSMGIGDPSGSNTFNFPEFIILGTGVGGTFWSPPITDPSQVTAPMPQSYLIDWVRVYQDSTLNLPASPSATQPLSIFTETHNGLDAFGRGATLNIWDSTFTMATVAPGAGGEGSQCYQLTIGDKGWMGLGVMGPPLGDNLLNYKNSYLCFKIKTTAACGFKAGIEYGGGTARWATLSPEYGYANDGQWHNIRIPMADLAGIDFSMITHYFMLLNVNGTTAGNVVYIDDIYWTNNSDTFMIPAVSGQEIIINSDTHSGYNVFSNGAALDSWGNTVTIANDASAAREGATGWKVTVGNAGWFGFGVSSKARDLSAFRNSTIRFDIKSTAASGIKFSISSANGYDCYYNLNKFGYVNDGQWHTISIPVNQCYGIDLSQITQYMMFLNDGACNANDVFYIDNFYYTAGTGSVTATPTPTRTATATPTPGGTEGIIAPVNSVASSSAQPAGNSCDGNTNTRWESASSDPQWIYWDLGSNKSLTKIAIDWEVASAANYTIQGSTNATNWTNLATVTNSSTENHNVITTNISGSYRYVRMYGTARTTGWGYSIFETSIYGYGSATPTPTRVATATPTPTRAATATPTPGGSQVVAPISGATASSAITPANESCDGNTGTRWESASSDPQWIYWDLGSNKSLAKIVIDWEVASAANYTIQGSTNATSWTNLATVTNSSTANHNIITTNISGSYRYVRMYGTKRTTGYGYSIWETTIYVTAGATATPTRPPATATPTPTPVSGNLALGKSVTVSSTENGGTPGSAAVDGNTGTRWSSAHSDPQWIRVDLGQTYSISRVVLRWETAAGKAYQIQTSTNGSTWSNAWSTTTGTGGVVTATFSPRSARYVRMYGTQRTTGYGYSLWEFEVYQQ